MTSDASRYNPAPDYIRGLIDRIPLMQRETARRIGVSPRYLRALAAGTCRASYPVQFALEALAVSPIHGSDQDTCNE